MIRNGTAKWLGQPDKQDLLDGTALLRIETKTGSNTYWVFHNGVRTRVRRMDTAETYEIVADKCSCPDSVHRNADCKHARATRFAIPLIRS